ncbi:hypothetical protein C8J57DRAFT_1229860 [Mycena rebaudengoi]|nr:hypothetical protein C8J57DRAFT_1229860 [Mycena rebaudengoi]
MSVLADATKTGEEREKMVVSSVIDMIITAQLMQIAVIIQVLLLSSNRKEQGQGFRINGNGTAVVPALACEALSVFGRSAETCGPWERLGVPTPCLGRGYKIPTCALQGSKNHVALQRSGTRPGAFQAKWDFSDTSALSRNQQYINSEATPRSYTPSPSRPALVSHDVEKYATAGGIIPWVERERAKKEKRVRERQKKRVE